jgi:hypothetical protein
MVTNFLHKLLFLLSKFLCQERFFERFLEIYKNSRYSGTRGTRIVGNLRSEGKKAGILAGENPVNIFKKHTWVQVVFYKGRLL